MRLDQARRPGAGPLLQGDSQPSDRPALLHYARHGRHDTQSLAGALDFDRNIPARCGVHQGDEFEAVGQGLTVDRQQSVLGAQARLGAGARRRRRLHQGVGIPGRKIEAQAGEQFTGFGERSAVFVHPQRQGPLAAVPAHHQGNDAIVAELPEQRDLQFLGVQHAAIAHLDDGVAAQETRRRRGTVEADLAHHGLDDFRAGHRQNGVQQRGKQQIHGGPGQQDGNSVHHGPAREGAMQLRRGDLTSRSPAT